MTDREMILEILQRATKITIFSDSSDYIAIENDCGEPIYFDFSSESGKLLSIWS